MGIFEASLLALSCSLDLFAACAAYGLKKIKIPPSSGYIINTICAAVLAAALWAGSLAEKLLPSGAARFTAFAVLLLIGLVRLLDSTAKALIRAHGKRTNEKFSREFKFSMLNFTFILKLYADPEDADVDEDKVISPSEAAALALALSVDGLAAGFGAAVGAVNIPAVIAVSLLLNWLSINLGRYAASRAAGSQALSWLGGVILIVLAVSKIL